MRQSKVLIFSLLVFAVFLCFLYFWPEDKVHLIACDVGQGDAILITKGFNQILIDGGPNDKVLGCLARNMPFWDRTLEIVINSHGEKDHLQGLLSIVKRYNLKYLVINSQVLESDLFREFHQAVLVRKIKVYSPKQGEKLKIGGLVLNFLWPKDKGDLALWREPLKEKTAVLGATSLKKHPNEDSIAVLLDYGSFEALFLGDLGSQQEESLVDYCLSNNCPRRIEVLKVGHHGSKSSTSQKLLDYFQPKKAIISVGRNSYGHPTQEVLDRLKAIGAEILRTDLLGDIKI